MFLGIVHLFKKRQFESRAINFSRYELLSALNWPETGMYYKRPIEGLKRLSGVSVFFDSCWWDYGTEKYCTVKFGLIDRFVLFNERTSGHSTFRSQVEMNETLFKSIQQGYAKNLNLSVYLSLSGNISKRLYRFLDKQRYRNSDYRINLFKLAHHRIGISENYYPSKIKSLLKKAADELVDKKILTSWKFERDVFYGVFNQESVSESYSMVSVKDENQAIVDILCNELDDHTSKTFFNLVANKIPYPVVYSILGNVKELDRESMINKSKGAYFTYLIKLKAEELQIAL